MRFFSNEVAVTVGGYPLQKAGYTSGLL
jgi:hypothetical protein